MCLQLTVMWTGHVRISLWPGPLHKIKKNKQTGGFHYRRGGCAAGRVTDKCSKYKTDTALEQFLGVCFYDSDQSELFLNVDL